MNVYVIAGGRRHVKIGISQNVEKRRRGIQTGCPFSIRIVQSWHTSRAREIERKAHRTFAKYRWAGEWFDVPQRAAALTVGILIKANPCHGLPDKAVERAVVFCRGCGNSNVLPSIPHVHAKLRCSKCREADKVHVIDVLVPNDDLR